ncbi:MAG: aminotransferase class I/II-fold pyridoxal phosphate-dependent enzyme, partial [Planctomycetota bacterium]
TMANQIAIRCACEPGDEIICAESTHSFHYETGAPAALSGAGLHTLDAPRGVFDGRQVRAAIRPRESHFPRSRMVIVENTNNRGGGNIWPLERIAEVSEAAREHDLHLHLDGARLMNACVARGCGATEFTRFFDSVAMCFSKGLGAPIGSIIAGSESFIRRAHRFRKMFGGGMRQVGVIAAAALYALEHNIERLAEDHANARRLAEGLAGLPGIRLDPQTVETNIVVFDIDAARLGSADAFAARLEQRGVRFFAIGPTTCRLVTHMDVDARGIDRALVEFRAVCNAAGR